MYKRLQQCHLSVYGYDNINDKYWGKKINKTCYMSFTICIKKQTYKLSLMTIDVFIDTKCEIKSIIDILSSNTKCVLDTECDLIQRKKPNAPIERIKPNAPIERIKPHPSNKSVM